MLRPCVGLCGMHGTRSNRINVIYAADLKPKGFGRLTMGIESIWNTSIIARKPLTVL